MSFVLEALKKQEAGTDPDAAVSLARSAAQGRRHRLWMGLFAAAVAVNAALLLWMYVGPERAPGATDQMATGAAGRGGRPLPAERRATDPGVPGAGPQSEAQQPSSVASPVDSPPVTDPVSEVSSPASAPARAKATAPAQSTVERASPARMAPTRPAPIAITLEDLPPDARARFPGIAFSTHIYAEDPDLRAVVANGQRLTEGERIRGLEIVQITASGVVLAFDNYRVEVPIVTDWDALD